MSKHEKDGLMSRLFSRQDAKLVNIKFCRGNREVISKQEFRSQICLVVDAHDEQISAGPARSMKPTVDVRRLVANM